MRIIFLALAACSAALGQVTLSMSIPNIPNGQIRAGNTIQIQVNVAGAPAATMAAFQMALRDSTGGTLTAQAAPASTAAGKQVTCARPTPSDDFKCIDIGMNQNVLSDGPVILFDLVIPSNASIGNSTITALDLLGATGTGNPVSITAAPLTFVLASPLSPCDVNSDGSTNVQDVQLVINQVLGLAAKTTDLDQDGKTTVIDAMRVVAAANGQSCRVGN